MVYPVYRPKAFTLMESMAVIAILAIMALMAFASYDSTVASGKDKLAQTTLTTFVAAQGIRHDTVGSFKSDPATAGEILGSYSFVGAASPSTTHTVVSFDVGSVDGEDFVVAVAVSPSGRCFLFKSFESVSTLPDERFFFEAGVVECSVNAATAMYGGVAW